MPLPLSSLSPIPISSDPHSNGSPVVQLHHGHDPHQNLPQQADAICSRPSDHPNQPIGSGNTLDQVDKDCLVLEDENGEKSDYSRKNSILGAEIAAAGVLSQLSSSHHVVGRWRDEGEKAFPLKKRSSRREDDEDNYKKTKTKLNNKKFADNGQQEKGEQEEEEEEEEVEEGEREVTKESADNNSTSSKNKRGTKGGAIMEGSRCSRVNGRGWRCCQQTLVGYSLCEHHLGKGRLRSMNSVRSRSSNLGSSAPSNKSTSTTAAATNKLALSSSSSTATLQESKMKQELVSDDDEKPLMMSAKKRVKLGMVKARSISSLLGQKDNNDIIIADNI